MGFTSVPKGWGFPSMAMRSSRVTLLHREWVGGNFSSSNSRASRRRSNFWEDSWSWVWAYRGDTNRRDRVRGSGYTPCIFTAPYTGSKPLVQHHCRWMETSSEPGDTA